MKARLLLIILLLLSFTAARAGSSFACVSVTGSLKEDKTVRQGDKVNGTIQVRNSSNKSCNVKIYQTDYLFFADGKTIYGEPGSVPRSNAGWISLSPVFLTIPPQDNASIHYNIQIPADPSLKGSYWSMVMVESAGALPEHGKEEPKKITVGIQTNIRYGIQIATDIEDSGERMIRFLNKELITKNGQKIFQFDIENTGERWLAPEVWVDLFNSEGLNIGRFESKPVRIYPGSSVRHKVDFTQVKPGKYQALVVADNGDDHIFGARYQVDIK